MKRFRNTTGGTYYTLKIHMEPENEGLVQMIFLFKQVIFRFHVSFQGCNASIVITLNT